MSLGSILAVTTLSLRIQWVLDHRYDPSTGRPWDAKALGAAAGLESAAHVGMMKRGTVKAPKAETLAKLATAARVSLRWLATGEGTPDSEDTPSVSESHRPELRNLAGWADAERMARQEHPDWPEWVWEATATSSPFDAPQVVTMATVEDMARYLRRHQAAPVTPEREARRAEIAASVKAIQDGDEPPPRPPPEEKPRGRRKG